MRKVVHIAHMGMRNAYKIKLENLEGRNHLEDFRSGLGE
jgi:hypothetical protein